MDNKMLTSVQPEEVQLLVFPLTMTQWRENVLSFEAPSSRIQLTQLREKSSLSQLCDSWEEV